MYFLENELKNNGLGIISDRNIKMVQTGSLLKFTYHQLDSPKMDSIVQACRGIVFDLDFNLVAKSFDRFFNFGEALEITQNFDWSNCTMSEKMDGSIIILFFDKISSTWIPSTKSSFGYGFINSESKHTFNSLVLELLGNKIYQMDKDLCYTFELCSPLNRVIRVYDEPKLTLLTVFDKETELTNAEIIEIANKHSFDLPFYFAFSCDKEKVFELIKQKEKNDPTFEGFVLKDKNGLRIKIKTRTYLELHTMKSNFSRTNLIKYCVCNDSEEILAYIPELKNQVEEVKEEIKNLKVSGYEFWRQHKNIENMKDFALAVKDHPLSGIFFKLKRTVNPDTNYYDMFYDSPDLIVKILSK